ncbi:MAG: hypothetical protein Q8O09_04615 [Bacillota bacterium]|nr:hypothetical protein [Bacillota bacterium]
MGKLSINKSKTVKVLKSDEDLLLEYAKKCGELEKLAEYEYKISGRMTSKKLLDKSREVDELIDELLLKSKNE